MTDRDSIRAALAVIPADDRELWLRIGMAIHAELPDDDGLALFDAWSRGSDTYDARAVRDTWRSFKPGRITIGTLWHEARQRGYRPAQPPVAEPPAERERREQSRAQQRAVEEAHYRARADAAAREAAALFADASTQVTSRYLERKGVQAHGVRFLGDSLLVPMHNAAGALVNLQRIAPDGGKRFLPGGRKSGCWHMLGDAAGAEVLLVAEGYATAATVHEATGRPVAVAFDAGNLVKVAEALRLAHPAARLLMAGDDDRATETRTGKNPGRLAAAAAARAAQGVAVFPAGLADSGTDFNDMARQAGPSAVRELIEGAVAAVLSGHVEPPPKRRRPSKAAPRPEAPLQGDGAAGDAHGPDTGRSRPSGPPDAPEGRFDRFRLTDEGVFYAEQDGDGRSRELWVCSPLKVAARTRDVDDDGWGYLLEFTNPAGVPRTWAMPARLLAGDGNEYRAMLLGMGLRIAHGSKPRALLSLYLQTRQVAETVICTDRVGWHAGPAYVFPRETISPEAAAEDDVAARIVYQSDGPAENPFRRRSTPAAWRAEVAELCVGNSRLVFAVSCAFAGPLMRPAGIDSGGFHFRGISSCGKTTLLRVAASVWGGSGYMQRWRATDNALEAVAAMHCDGLLILDELAQVDPKIAGATAYMLGNETSKARSTRTGQARPRLTWRLLFLSAGEIGLAAHMAEGGKLVRTGQELRMVDVPAEVSQGTVFETTPGLQGGAAFAVHLAKVCEAHHGEAGHEWVRWCVDELQGGELRKRLRSGVDSLARAWVAAGASGQVQRVARRFALVAMAGEMASEAGLTGWPPGEASKAALACFRAWLAHRVGGEGDAEQAQMLSAVRLWLQTNGQGRFAWWHRLGDDRAPDKGLLAGVRLLVSPDGSPIRKDSDHLVEFGERISRADAEGSTVDYFVFPDVFEAEACKDFDRHAVLRLLRGAGHLVPDKARPFDCKPRLPVFGHTRCYRIKASIFEGDA